MAEGETYAQRPALRGTRHMVAAGHYGAAHAAFAILEAGGNAVDAAVAGGLALGVLQPDIVNVAGVAPIMLRMADGVVQTIAGLGYWPAATDPDRFTRENGGHIPGKHPAHGRSGRAGRLDHGASRFGTMTFGEVAQAAIRFADEGFPVYPLLADMIAVRKDKYAGFLECRDLPARRAAAQGRHVVRAEGPGAHPALHGGRRSRQPRPPWRPRGRTRGSPCRVLSRRYRPGDRGLPQAGGGMADGAGSRRLPFADRTRAIGSLCGNRCLHVRRLVPGAGARPGAQHPRCVGPQGGWAQQRRLPSHGGGGAEAGLCRSRGLLRRSAARRCAAGRPCSIATTASRGGR